MRHLFIINPRAGKRDSTEKLLEQIEALRREKGVSCEIVLTRRGGDAEAAARKAAESGEAYRIYACGGDGTLNEAANGVLGAPNVELTVVPVGTGNDFMKNYGEDSARFLDLFQLWDGPAHELDVISCNGRAALTIACVGVDARVAADVHKYNRYPAVGGSRAYLASVAVHFFKNLAARFTISCNGQTTIGEYTLICVCNGRYYGGGFMPVADARMDDGALDTLVVRRVSHGTFLRLLPAYAAGDAWKYPEIVHRLRAPEVRIQAREPFPVVLDGEILMTDDARIGLSPHKLRFFAPEGASCNRTARLRLADRKGKMRKGQSMSKMHKEKSGNLE